jgi:hypothetical protein
VHHDASVCLCVCGLRRERAGTGYAERERAGTGCADTAPKPTHTCTMTHPSVWRHRRVSGRPGCVVTESLGVCYGHRDHAHTCTHTCTQMHTDAHTDAHTHAHTCTHMHTQAVRAAPPTAIIRQPSNPGGATSQHSSGTALAYRSNLTACPGTSHRAPVPARLSSTHAATLVCSTRLSYTHPVPARLSSTHAATLVCSTRLSYTHPVPARVSSSTHARSWRRTRCICTHLYARASVHARICVCTRVYRGGATQRAGCSSTTPRSSPPHARLPGAASEPRALITYNWL